MTDKSIKKRPNSSIHSLIHFVLFLSNHAISTNSNSESEQQGFSQSYFINITINYKNQFKHPLFSPTFDFFILLLSIEELVKKTGS